MSEEELVNLNMKDVILNQWKSKLSYPLNHKDIEELENIIDYYEGLNQKYKEVIDKAVLELVNIDGDLSNSQLSDRICNLIDILKEVG